ncbi:MAG: radical SAM protein [Pseudomonadota bacterium]|nr:radical SAM protein [Pseudomonadota bacterium]
MPPDTTSLCRVCKKGLPAAHVERDGGIWLEKTCLEHGFQTVQIAVDAEWWRRTLAEGALPTPPDAKKEVTHGCPFDCGPCTQHQQRVHLPILPITAACNLDCPICYTHNHSAGEGGHPSGEGGAERGAWHLDDGQLDAVLRHLRVAAPEARLLNLTGGEPTMHPRLLEVLERCHAEGIDRVTLSTHGLRLARDEALVSRLAALGVRVVLSFDSFDEGTNEAMLGGGFGALKIRALEMLAKYGVDTTLLPVLAKGRNDHEIGLFVAYMLGHDHIRSLELHPMTFTGQGGNSFDRAARLTADEAVRSTAAQCGLSVDDFVPSPLAHPLCYQCAYLLKLDPVAGGIGAGDAGLWVPFTRFMRRDQLRALLTEGLYLLPGPRLDGVFQEVIDALWSGAFPCRESEAVLATLRRLLHEMFAPGLSDRERVRVAERSTRALYIHTHMDEESFDTDRVRLCPVGIREPDGTNVPSCSYNVLYRSHDPRFVAHPAPMLTEGGRRW